jgi:hypothetical protein
MTDEEASCLVEFGEARAYARLVEGGTPALRERHGLGVHRVGSAYAFVAAGLRESLMLNRVIGLGLKEPATVEIFVALDALYRAHGLQNYAVELSPTATFGDGANDLRQLGFVPFKQTAMLYRSPGPLQARDCGLAIQQVGSARAADFAGVCCTVFGFNEPYPELLQATFQDPSWQHWLALDDDTPVAAAILSHFDDGVSWIGWVGTILPHRGRGAQSAITVAQLGACVDQGSRWVTLEASTGTKSRPSPSLRNYKRLGWTHAYNRAIYLRRLPA